MIHRSKGLDSEITDFEHHHKRTCSVETIPSQALNLKHLEIINVSDKPTKDTKLESS